MVKGPAAHGGEHGFFVGGEPEALLSASSDLYEAASRTDDVAARLAVALGPAATTVAATVPFSPARAAAVAQALHAVLASPQAGLGSVALAYHGASLHLRQTAQALEAAGTVGLLARGGLGLFRGERPTVLASTEGIDLRREATTGSWSVGAGGRSSSFAVREVMRPDGSTFFVVEAMVGDKSAKSAGVQVNGVGGFGEAGVGDEKILRWAVPTLHDAELLLAAASGPLVLSSGRLLSLLPKPTESVVAKTATVTVVGGVGPVPGVTSVSGTVAYRHEVTTLGSGDQRIAISLSGSGQSSLLGVVGTGGAGSAKVTVHRDPAGAVNRISLSASTEVDRGRHGLPMLEAGNREATLVEREWEVTVTPAARAAADRVAAAVAHAERPDPADVQILAGGMQATTPSERTYDTRHQQASVDVAVRTGGGGAGGIDTAVLRSEEQPHPGRATRNG